MREVLGVLLIFVVCPLLGGLPLIRWIGQWTIGQDLRRVGTGNVSVSAAFYHGGRWVGVLAVLSEALKGIAAVLLARSFLPDPVWEIMALITLVMGRYWFGKGAGTTNVVWGYIVHDPGTALLTAIIGGIGFTILRERQAGKFGVLVLLPLLTALRYPTAGELIGANITLSLLIGWIYRKIPDDLTLPTDRVQSSSQSMFRFFRGDRSLLSLSQPLTATKVGGKAASLSQLIRWGYPVPAGWVLPPGDDPSPLLAALEPSPDQPFVVRSSAIDEDASTASAAGQYESLLNITSVAALEQAILRCQASYNLLSAARYRQDRGITETGMAVIVQTQVQGVFSGVAFSRDPITRQGEAVLIEALAGGADRVVSGRYTPERYRVWVQAATNRSVMNRSVMNRSTQGSVYASDQGLDHNSGNASGSGQANGLVVGAIEGGGTVPTELVQQVAILARQIETQCHGIPQDIEWSYDGEQVWLLQARPITTLTPIWTRKIAAEVIPGFIRPLTWSINRPLTCGVWGEIFTLVLGDRAEGLDFEATATLHRSAAYFNATLLGEIFRRMGLPPESLEFLTRGAKFSKPPLRTTLRNTAGLLRLLRAELRLETDFQRDRQQLFDPGFANLKSQPLSDPPDRLLQRIDQILQLLQRATYYSILAPLSAALRQAIGRVPQTQLDNSQTPEVASLRAIQALADQWRTDAAIEQWLREEKPLTDLPDNHPARQQFMALLEDYGYLSEVGTDIAVPTWREDPHPVEALLRQFVQQSPPAALPPKSPAASWSVRRAQRRLDLKGQVTTCYSKLLAELRWSFVALEEAWLRSGLLQRSGDVFFLTFTEIRQLVADPAAFTVPPLLAHRQVQFEQDQTLSPPFLVYGNSPPTLLEQPIAVAGQLSGIAASPGQVEGKVLVLRNFADRPPIDRQTILVVPYTDSGWAVLLAQAGGLIAEVGGQLSHGAIVAREYGIPAIMDVHNAMQILQTGERVRIDGSTGVIDRLDEPS